MKKNQIIILRTLMAVAIMFGVQTTASAQLGKLKGLADKAKSAVTDKVKAKVEKKVDDAKNDVKERAEATVSNATGVSVGEDGSVKAAN